MSSIQRTARIAGVLYLLVAITGAVGLLYIPSAFVVPGDAAATANNIAASEATYRIGVVSDFLAQILFIFLVVTLYRLLEGVDRKLAALMVILAVASVPMSFLNTLNMIAPLVVLSGADFLSVFDGAQLDALAMAFLELRDNGIIAASAYWGLWLFPFGLLVKRSGYFPRILGVLLIIAGAAYLVGCFTYFLAPDLAETASPFLLVAEILGEVSMMVWLLAKGAEAPAAVEPAA